MVCILRQTSSRKANIKYKKVLIYFMTDDTSSDNNNDFWFLPFIFLQEKGVELMLAALIPCRHCRGPSPTGVVFCVEEEGAGSRQSLTAESEDGESWRSEECRPSPDNYFHRAPSAGLGLSSHVSMRQNTDPIPREKFTIKYFKMRWKIYCRSSGYITKRR